MSEPLITTPLRERAQQALGDRFLHEALDIATTKFIGMRREAFDDFPQGEGLRDRARAILRRLAGAEFVELGGSDECCGFGGSFSVRLPEVSTAILDKKLTSIEATGADCVVACDAGCLMQIGGGLGRRGSRVRALHLAELLERERGGAR